MSQQLAISPRSDYLVLYRRLTFIPLAICTALVALNLHQALQCLLILRCSVGRGIGLSSRHAARSWLIMAGLLATAKSMDPAGRALGERRRTWVELLIAFWHTKDVIARRTDAPYGMPYRAMVLGMGIARYFVSLYGEVNPLVLHFLLSTACGRHRTRSEIQEQGLVDCALC